MNTFNSQPYYNIFSNYKRIYRVTIFLEWWSLKIREKISLEYNCFRVLINRWVLGWDKSSTISTQRDVLNRRGWGGRRRRPWRQSRRSSSRWRRGHWRMTLIGHRCWGSSWPSCRTPNRTPMCCWKDLRLAISLL